MMCEAVGVWRAHGWALVDTSRVNADAGSGTYAEPKTAPQRAALKKRSKLVSGGVLQSRSSSSCSSAKHGKKSTLPRVRLPPLERVTSPPCGTEPRNITCARPLQHHAPLSLSCIPHVSRTSLAPRAPMPGSALRRPTARADAGCCAPPSGRYFSSHSAMLDLPPLGQRHPSSPPPRATQCSLGRLHRLRPHPPTLCDDPRRLTKLRRAGQTHRQPC